MLLRVASRVCEVTELRLLKVLRQQLLDRAYLVGAGVSLLFLQLLSEMVRNVSPTGDLQVVGVHVVLA